MTVLHVTRDFPPHRNGGLSTAVGGMVRGLTAAGIDCAVVSFDGYRPRANSSDPVAPRATRVDGVPCLRVVASGQLAAASAFATGLGPTLIHVHHAMLWEFAAGVARACGARTIKSVHVAQAEQSRLRGLGHETLSARSQRQALAEADRVIAPSAAVASLLVAADPGIAQRLRVQPLGTDDSPNARDAAAGRDRQVDGPVLFAGRFADINGIAELVAALPGIAAAAPKARFVIAGGMPENPRAERRWRERCREALAAVAADRLELTGWLEPSALSQRYAEATVLLAPSWFETFGQVVLEGQLHGLAVVASATGGLRELVDDTRTGLLVPPRDVPRLVATTVQLLEDRGLARRLGTAAAAAVRSKFLWPQLIPQLVSLYRELDPG